MDYINVNEFPKDAADFLIKDADMSDPDAVLGDVAPGTRCHTAGYAVLKEKGLDGSWTEIE